MRRSRWAGAVLGGTALLLMAGCGGDFPPWSAPSPTDRVALRAGGAGEIEAVLVPCEPARVARIELVTGLPSESRAASPRAWRVDFAPPVEIVDPVPVGSVPAGATATVPWAGLGSVDPERDLLVVVVLDDGTEWSVSADRFVGRSEDRVRFQGRMMSPEEFAENSGCP